jgi:transcriptional regulator of met regulon
MAERGEDYWVQKFTGEKFKKLLQGKPPSPSPERTARAQQIMNDILRVTHFEEIVSDLKGFVQNDVLPAAPAFAELTGQPLPNQEEFQKNFNMAVAMFDAGKTYILTIAPKVIAGSFDDEELDVLQKYTNSNYTKNAFANVYNLSKAIVAIKKQDLEEAISFAKANKDKIPALSKRTREEKKLAEKDAMELWMKWAPKAQQHFKEIPMESHMQKLNSGVQKYLAVLTKMMAKNSKAGIPMPH